MDLFTIIVVIVVIGIAMWAINKYIPMQPAILKILNITVVAFLVFWILKISGVIAYLSKIVL